MSSLDEMTGSEAISVAGEVRDMGFWQTAYDAHAPAVLAFLQRRLRRREEAEDLLQETFVRAIRANALADEERLRPYLLRTARNLLLNQLRRPHLVVGAEGEDEGRLEQHPQGSLSPEGSAAFRAFRRALERALSGLAEAHRRAFQLAVFEQRSYAEIARLTGWSLPQVKVNLYRARQRLLADLAEHLPRVEEAE